MTITPQQAGEKRDKDSLKEFNRFTEEIDEMLAEGGRTYGTNGMSSYVIGKIMTEYTSAGWKVELVPDWRDGNFLRFEG